jgi:hypothetical protein
MRTSVLSLGALALGLASAHEYPNCESDNCYRNLVDERFAEEAVAFCPEFLAGTTTAASAIPTNFNNCDGNVKAVSSACSCITYTASATATPTSSEVPETTTSAEEPETTTTEAPETITTEVPETTTTTDDDDDEECTSTSTTKWTTSTITTTTTRTITSCSAEVTDCPGGGTPTVTTEVIVTTTVCPVTDEPEVPEPTGSFVPSSSLPTLLPTLTTARNTTNPPKPTSSGPATAGAAHVVGGGVAALAGLFAAFL